MTTSRLVTPLGRRAVLDPTLALSPHGLTLAQRLGGLLELWVVRELWHILDNTYFYLHQPEQVFADALRCSPQQLIRALQQWERVRLETDLVGLKLHWIGDGVSESLLPEGTPPQLIAQTEALACALDQPQLLPALRDALALAAALGTAFILTHCHQDQPPAVCLALQRCGMTCQRLGVDDPLVVIERDQLQQLLVQAGLAKLLWSGLELAVLHLVVPDVSLPPTELTFLESFTPPNPWQSAQGFWYPLAVAP
ncbi:hypothetical protein [Candidatus Cyanaurora vandensis]|uniref:hypothetical protein n=1 Tax=Candidatus Cyanaurora vandensis TaxID=2714958 RepID=UPI00257BA51B|nr:hypothetical protein [Candidatus Cyanaurora vandensis]